MMKSDARSTRRATAVTLALALAVAVYLNWEYARSGTGITAVSADSTAQEVSVLSQEDALETSASVADVQTAADAGMVSAAAPADSVLPVSDGLVTESEALTAADKNYGEAQLVSISKDSSSEFFEKARLDRTKTRDAAVDQIEQSLKKSSLSTDEKQALTTQLTACLEDITAENEIETLVKAKGFADCLCFLQNGKANITVMTSSGDGLNASQAAQIRDIILSKCKGMTAQDITIVEVK